MFSGLSGHLVAAGARVDPYEIIAVLRARGLGGVLHRRREQFDGGVAGLLHESREVATESPHGHRFISDVLLGATADRVRHLVKIPVLLLRAQ